MKKLSLGMDSTLGNWIHLTSIAFGGECIATRYLKEKAESSLNGLNEEVVADEVALLRALMKMNENFD